MIIHLDYETRSVCDIKLGSTRYARHPSTQVTCMGYAVEDEPEKIAVPGRGVRIASLLTAWKHRGAVFVAHNASFERAITRHVFGVDIPISQWICTAALARLAGLPGSLEMAAKTLGLDVEKGDNSAMLKTCKPKPANNWIANRGGSWWHEPPEQFIIPEGLPKPYLRKFLQEHDKDAALFEELYAYCKQDVATERALYHALPPMSPRERRLWVLDAKINQTGIPVDVELARLGDRISSAYTSARIVDLPKLTGGLIQTPGQNAKMLSFLHGEGVHLNNLQKQTVLDALAGDLTEKARAVLEIRAAASGNAQSKFAKFAMAVNEDHRLRDSFIYYGSHTGRWTSEGVQTNNIMRPEIKHPEIFVDAFRLSGGSSSRFMAELTTDTQTREFLRWKEMKRADNKPCDTGAFYRAVYSALVRACIKAPPGKTLIAMDYSAIEARGAMWLADDEDTLNAFRRKEKLYERTAAAIFGMPEEQIGKESFQRMIGKKIFLGGQYGIGPDKFSVSCQREGVRLEEGLDELIVKKYRETYYKIPELWRRIDDIIREVFTTRKPVLLNGKALFYLTADGKSQTLCIQLPGGRVLYYPHARYKEELRPTKVYKDGKWTGEYEDRLKWSFSYFGKVQGKGYGRVHMWGGSFTENIVQAFCRDLLCTSLLEIDRLNLGRIIMHVYDEVVVEVEKNRAEEVFAEIERIMRAGAPWSAGMPIDCEGWIGERYRK